MRYGIKQWFEGLQSPGGALAERGDTKAEAAGHAVRGSIEGALIGALTGSGNALIPGGLSPKACGVAAFAALAGSVALADRGMGRTLANANVALSALAMHGYMESRVAHKANTATQVLTNKARAIAAHGEGKLSAGSDGDVQMQQHGEMDPLIEYGAQQFGPAQ
jgi:hypothetical protein